MAMSTNSSELELREPESASTRMTETVTGSHRFKLVGYSLEKGIGIGNFLTSAIFTVGGYNWIVNYYPDGDCKESKDYLSFYLSLQSEGWEVKAQFKFTMLNQSGNLSKLSCKTSALRKFGSTCRSWGFSTYIERKTFEASDYLKNDSFTILCTVTVVKQSHPKLVKLKEVVVPPSNLNKQLSRLLETGEGADVTFEVSGKVFSAHKWLLAARSPVFHAQFFGPMNEKGDESIKLNNIEAEVFRVFLHFIYSDSMPDLEEGADCGEEQDEMVIYQHLLVAADRYEVERLKIICENKLAQKIICENKLAQNIEIQNFATTLTLADQHNCAQLKASCLEFVSSPKILVDVMKTDGYEHLTQSCPFILKELLGNTNNDK